MKRLLLKLLILIIIIIYICYAILNLWAIDFEQVSSLWSELKNNISGSV